MKGRRSIGRRTDFLIHGVLPKQPCEGTIVARIHAMRRWKQVLPCVALGLALVVVFALSRGSSGRTSAKQPLEASRQPRRAPSVCDISNAACQAELVEAVRAMFDLEDDFRAPEVRFVSADELRALNKGDANEQLVSEGLRSALVSLGLLQEEDTQAGSGAPSAAQQAVYRSRTHDVLIALPGDQRALLHANVMLVHELIHAAQAQHGLFERKTGSLDQRLAWRARLEGEAVVRSYRFKAQLERVDPSAITWPNVFGEWSKRSFESISRARFPLVVAVATLPYARGAFWYESRPTGESQPWPEHFRELLGVTPDGARIPDTVATPRFSCDGQREELGALPLLAFLLPASSEQATFLAATTLSSDLLCVQDGGAFTWQLAWSGDVTGVLPLIQSRAGKLDLAVRLRPSARASTEPSVEISGRS